MNSRVNHLIGGAPMQQHHHIKLLCDWELVAVLDYFFTINWIYKLAPLLSACIPSPTKIYSYITTYCDLCVFTVGSMGSITQRFYNFIFFLHCVSYAIMCLLCSARVEKLLEHDYVFRALHSHLINLCLSPLSWKLSHIACFIEVMEILPSWFFRIRAALFAN